MSEIKLSKKSLLQIANSLKGFVVNADFKESDHDRAPDGKFTSGGGGAGGSSKDKSSKTSKSKKISKGQIPMSDSSKAMDAGDAIADVALGELTSMDTVGISQTKDVVKDLIERNFYEYAGEQGLDLSKYDDEAKASLIDTATRYAVGVTADRFQSEYESNPDDWKEKPAKKGKGFSETLGIGGTQGTWVKRDVNKSIQKHMGVSEEKATEIMDGEVGAKLAEEYAQVMEYDKVQDFMKSKEAKEIMDKSSKAKKSNAKEYTLKVNAKQMPKTYFAKHMVEGVAGYDSENILVRNKAIQEMCESMRGIPVFVIHQEVDMNRLQETADGYVSRCFYNKNDGWWWCEFIAVSDKAHDAIAKGWAVSNAYGFMPEDTREEKGTYLNIQYDKEILNGEYNHLAIVPNPRYEDAVIMSPEEYKQYNSQLCDSLENVVNNSK